MIFGVPFQFNIFMENYLCIFMIYDKKYDLAIQPW